MGGGEAVLNGRTPIRVLVADNEPALLDAYRRIFVNVSDTTDSSDHTLADLRATLFGHARRTADRPTFVVDVAYANGAEEAVAAVRSAHESATPFHLKKATNVPSMTWSESVDEALCFGWIDGLRRRIDDERYTIRFTPRRSGSNWSRVNLAKVDVLIGAGRMEPAGLAAYEARTRDPAADSTYEEPNESP